MTKIEIHSSLFFSKIPNEINYGASHGPVRLIGRCVSWAGASHGPVHLMGLCVSWAGASHGPGNAVCLNSKRYSKTVLCYRTKTAEINVSDFSYVCNNEIA